jgi:hypothetical protein
MHMSFSRPACNKQLGMYTSIANEWRHRGFMVLRVVDKAKSLLMAANSLSIHLRVHRYCTFYDTIVRQRFFLSMYWRVDLSMRQEWSFALFSGFSRVHAP